MKKIFIEGQNILARANLGWQDNSEALWGIKEGYKNAADDLVKIALKEGEKSNTATLDTYIFPIIFLYRHSLEISLKLIYFRCYSEIPPGDHNLVILLDHIKEKVIDVFNDPEFISNVKSYKKRFIKFSTDDIDFDEICSLLSELQKANNEANIDEKAQVWRYLMRKNGDLYFTGNYFVDYNNLKTVIGELYEVLDYLYHIADEYLSS